MENYSVEITERTISEKTNQISDPNSQIFCSFPVHRFINIPYFLEIKETKLSKENKGYKNEEVKEIAESTNYLFILPNREEYFSSDFLDEINLARYDLENYSKNFEKLFDKVNLIKEEYYLVINSRQKIPLHKGRLALIKCFHFLQNHDTKKLEKFELIDELKAPFYGEEIISKTDIREFKKKSMKDLQIKFKGRYKIITLLSLNCIDIPKYAFLLSIIDGEEEVRNLIFSKKVKFVGINFKKDRLSKIKLNITFACKTEKD